MTTKIETVCGHPMSVPVEGIYSVDSTPDEEYAIRILQAYRQRCDCLWTDNMDGDAPISRVLVAMNESQKKRAAILDEAIRTLKMQRQRR
jgi:hypothetical protein